MAAAALLRSMARKIAARASPLGRHGRRSGTALPPVPRSSSQPFSSSPSGGSKPLATNNKDLTHSLKVPSELDCGKAKSTDDVRAALFLFCGGLIFNAWTLEYAMNAWDAAARQRSKEQADLISHKG